MCPHMSVFAMKVTYLLYCFIIIILWGLCLVMCIKNRETAPLLVNLRVILLEIRQHTLKGQQHDCSSCR